MLNALSDLPHAEQPEFEPVDAPPDHAEPVRELFRRLGFTRKPEGDVAGSCRLESWGDARVYHHKYGVMTACIRAAGAEVRLFDLELLAAFEAAAKALIDRPT